MPNQLILHLLVLVRNYHKVVPRTGNIPEQLLIYMKPCVGISCSITLMAHGTDILGFTELLQHCIRSQSLLASLPWEALRSTVVLQRLLFTQAIYMPHKTHNIMHAHMQSYHPHIHSAYGHTCRQFYRTILSTSW